MAPLALSFARLYCCCNAVVGAVVWLKIPPNCSVAAFRASICFSVRAGGGVAVPPPEPVPDELPEPVLRVLLISPIAATKLDVLSAFTASSSDLVIVTSPMAIEIGSSETSRSLARQ